MTRDTGFEESITTKGRFSGTLRELLVAAHGNGIDVSGAWEIRSNGAAPDWEAMVTELAKDGDGVDVASDGGEE